MNKKNLKKVSFKVFRKTSDVFDSRIKEIGLKRDSFLNQIIKTELQTLKTQLGSKKNSPSAKKYISNEFAKLDTKLINVQLEPELADELTSIAKEHNLIRDSIINRILIFTVFPEKLREYLGLDRSSKVDYSEISTSPLVAIEQTISDPMYFLNKEIEKKYPGESIFSIELGTNLIGICCHLDDSEVPDTPAYIEQQNALDMLNSFLTGE